MAKTAVRALVFIHAQACKRLRPRTCLPACVRACVVAAGPQERPLPGKLCKALVGQLARQEKWGLNYAFDGRKNIYSPGRFLPAVRRAALLSLRTHLCVCVCVHVVECACTAPGTARAVVASWHQ